MRRTLAIIATLTILAGATSCGQAAPSAQGTATPTAASPSPTVDRRAELKAMVDGAGIKPKDLGVKRPMARTPSASSPSRSPPWGWSRRSRSPSRGPDGARRHDRRASPKLAV